MLSIKAPQAWKEVPLFLPGSKSLSNRILVLRHLSGDTTGFVENLSDSDDTRLLQAALRDIREGGPKTIDVGHAGTDLRFLTALLSVTEGEWVLRGSPKLHTRPIAGLVEALRGLGARILYTETEGHPPLQISGRKLQGGSVRVTAGTSSQFLSALLLIAPFLEQGLEIIPDGQSVSRSYVQMTLGVLKQAGVAVEATGDTFQVSPLHGPLPQNRWQVESDWSSASYWFSLCALSGQPLHLRQFLPESLQGDSVLPRLYAQLGLETRYRNNGIFLSRTRAPAPYFRHDFSDCPDIAMTLAVTCAALGVPSRLEGLSTLRLKESDRVEVMLRELSALGLHCRYGDDTLELSGMVHGHSTPQIDPLDDHRIAMSFAPLACVLPEVRILRPDVVSKSYPLFWSHLKSLGFDVTSPP